MDKTGAGLLFGILFFVLMISGIVSKSILLISLSITALIIIFVFALGGTSDNKKNAKREMEIALNKNDFIPDKSRLSFNLLRAISLNDSEQKIAYLTRSDLSKPFSFKEFQFSEIIEAKIIKNNETITSTSIGSTVGRALVGGVLFGGLGAILAGVGSKTSSVEKIRELTLEIIVDDVLNPRYTFTFYKSNSPLDNGSERFNNLIEDVEGWYRSLTVIINRNDKLRSV